NQTDSNVSVLLGATAPGAATVSFATPATFATFFNPRAVAVGDINGDGKPDLVVANYSNLVSVLLNTTAPGAAAPSFSAQIGFADANRPYSVVLTDINGDGKLDLAVANLTGNTASVLLNTTAPGAATP